MSGVDSSTVTVSSEGTCLIRATKAGTDNYLEAISDVGTITFHLYISNLPVARAPDYPTEIVLVGQTPWESDLGDEAVLEQLPQIISGSTTILADSAGWQINLTGLGFTGTISVKIKGRSLIFTINSDTSITVQVPNNFTAMPGKILLQNGVGRTTSAYTFTGEAN